MGKAVGHVKGGGGEGRGGKGNGGRRRRRVGREGRGVGGERMGGGWRGEMGCDEAGWVWVTGSEVGTAKQQSSMFDSSSTPSLL